MEGTNDVTLGTPETADQITPQVNDGFNRIDPNTDNVSDIDNPQKAPTETDKAASDKAAADKAVADKAAAEKVEADKGKGPTADEQLQALTKERDDLKIELAKSQGKIEGLNLTPQQKKEAESREEKGLPYKDITKMSKEEVLEWQEDDPVGYAANLYQQFVHEAREQIKAEQAEAKKQDETKTYQERVSSTFQQYGKDNPDFLKMFDSQKGVTSPDLQKVIDENPGIGAIGAHMKMTMQARIDAAVKEAVDKAVKETTEKVTKNFQAKRNAEVITDSGTVKDPAAIPDELKHPDKYGGRTQALASRLSRMRQAAMGG